jgi:hypothetical protein
VSDTDRFGDVPRRHGSREGQVIDAAWLMRRGEGRAVLASGAAYFFLLCGY